MADHNMGDTAKLVGAMMRLRHNTKFKGGEVDLGEAPNSVASPKEHLDFLRLFRGQIQRRRRRDDGQAQEEKEARDEEMLAASFAEAQIRALVNSELEACLVLHESKEFWQQRLDRSGASLLNWIEMGPWTWRTHSRQDCYLLYRRSLSRCRYLLRNKILSAGSLQLHLTQMKQAYIEGTLDAWTDAALVMVKRTLEAFAASSGVGSGSRTSDRVRSLASAVASRDCSPVNETGKGTGLTLRNQDRSSVLRRVFARSVASVSLGRGDGGNSVRRRGHDDVEGDEQVEGEEGREDEASASEAKTTLDDIMDSQSRVAEGRHLSAKPGLGQKGLEGEEAGVTQASLPDLMRDAPEEEQNGSGDETGRRLAQKGKDDVMSALLATSGEVVATVETHQKNMVPLLLGRFAAPSRLRRNWMFLAVAAPVALTSMAYMYRHRGWMQGSMLKVRGSFWQFVREHISEPFWGIYDELVHAKSLTLTDANALADSSSSLERMLEAFIKDTKPDLSQEEVQKMAMTGDMSVVSREYERSIINAWKNFVAGDIVRMMLIQVQFIKRELLIATTALGQLARENELNLRMMATVPALLLAWGSYRAARPVYYWLKSEKSRESTFTAMRTIVLAMERLLNLRHREGTWLQITADHPSEAGEGLDAMEAGPRSKRGSLLRPAGHSDNCTRQVVVSAGRGQGRMAVRVLDELDLGKLMMLVHQLLRLIRSGPRRFPRRDLINLHEDLAELVGERGLVSVGQQLQIVQRVQRSYKFLLPRR